MKKKKIQRAAFERSLNWGERPIMWSLRAFFFSLKIRSGYPKVKSVVYFSSVKVKGAGDCIFKTVFAPAVHMDACTHSRAHSPSHHLYQIGHWHKESAVQVWTVGGLPSLESCPMIIHLPSDSES